MYFWWKIFWKRTIHFFFFFLSLTSVLLLVLGCRPQASNKGWFMQMAKEEMLSLLSHYLFVPLSISLDNHISSDSPLLS